MSNNERKLVEIENYLVNKNLEFEYEKERCVKVEEENNWLFVELELLLDEWKKDGFLKEVIELLNRVRECVVLENIEVVRVIVVVVEVM